MLYKPGSETVIWGIPLDVITVDAHEADAFLAEGWFAHPFEARDSRAPEMTPEVIAIDAGAEDKPRRGRPPKAKE
jgi:hypothetical protein